MLKVKNKTPKRPRLRSAVFIANFEHYLHIDLVFFC